MNAVDALTGIFLGVALLVIAVKGNSPRLVDLAKRDVGFVKWAIAVGILVYLKDIPELKGPVSLLIVAAFVGLGLTAEPQIKAGAQQLFSSFGA